MKHLEQIVAENARAAGVERIVVRLVVEVDAAKISPDERRQIPRLAGAAVSRALSRRSWFISARLTDTV
jgi:hypothetical protein